ncbi:hypothetical protein MKZ38_006069 [Zalerion maritima]|uniref:F-box domain-containing protein n=1 Tax=Zalerion maritima TaxID=339359 RepID=A0AAD5RKC0_9PEZI|nr:hypothetical protein MKZ38_006069 [Zalerion maritima]
MRFFRKKGDGGKKKAPAFSFPSKSSDPCAYDNDDDNCWPAKPSAKQSAVAGHHNRDRSYGGSDYGNASGMAYHTGFQSRPSHVSAQILARLPSPILERVFGFVCPHSQDESCETCEQSAVDDACMLCDLRDLAHAGIVCKKWRASAVKVMYHSIRIDSVHYCQREATLAEKRKRGSFLDRNADPEDTARSRLVLLSRSVREDPTRLGKRVQFLKTPYMLREAAKSDLARTIAVMPNLRYVDLPEGMYADEPPYATLRLEVQARCPDLRRMTYLGGSERSLAQLAVGNIWTAMETLELKKVNIDPVTLRHALGALTQLRALKVTECPAFADDLLQEYEGIPPLPSVAELILSKAPQVTAAGICAYLAQATTRKSLKVLTLTTTGVKTSTLHQILASAPALAHLSIIDVADTSFPNASNQAPTPPLHSRSLQTLHYEITPSSKAGAFAAAVCQSHYTYLSSSILSGGLSHLQQLYVRDPNFADALIGLPPPPPVPGFAAESNFRQRAGSAGMLPSPTGSLSPPNSGGPFSAQQRPTSFAPPGLRSQNTGRLSTNNPFAHQLAANIPAQLEVFSKGDEDLDWSALQMAPGGYGNQRRGSSHHTRSNSRPISSYGLGADIMGGMTGWGAGDGRRSVMVGDGAGGFLAVPGQQDGPKQRTPSRSAWGSDDDEDLWPGSRPKSSAGAGGAKRDLWR